MEALCIVVGISVVIGIIAFVVSYLIFDRLLNRDN